MVFVQAIQEHPNPILCPTLSLKIIRGNVYTENQRKPVLLAKVLAANPKAES